MDSFTQDPNQDQPILGAPSPSDAAFTQVSPAAPAPMPQQPAAPASGGSRLGAILSAVAKTVDTGLASIPSQGRPSFVTGLGQGARAAQAAEANQQAIKFRDLDTQIRLAELHNQDLKMQNDTQAQQDAHNVAELHMRAMANDLGIDYDTLPNHGPAVMDHLTAQTAMNGAASVPAGTHISADGENIYIPKDPGSPQTQDAQKQLYQGLAPALGLPSLPAGAQFVPPKNMNMLTNKLTGFDLGGSPYKHDVLPAMIATTQAQRDNLAKNGGSPAQLKALDNVVGIYKANLDALDKHQATVLDAASQRKQDEQTNAIQQKGEQQRQTNAAKPQKLQVVLAQNPSGGSDVMTSDDAAQQGLKIATPLKSGDVQKLNGTIAGFNDVQTKTNQLADIVNSGDFAKVQPGIAQAMIEKGLTVDMHGVSVPFGRINAALNSENAKVANPATRKFAVAWLGAHEAVTQLPRLQTFGQSNRMTEKQMEASQQMLPQAGDDPALAQQKLNAFQDVLDPLRKQVPRLQGANLLPSFRERQQQRQAPSGGSTLGQMVSNPVGRLVPSN